jgi:hypothetical protein
MDRLERDLERLKDRHEALTQTVEIIAGMQRKNETLMAQTIEAINTLANIANSHEKRKNPAAVRLGKLRAKSMSQEEWQSHGAKYGPSGGAARAAALTPERRAEIARKAADARWAKAKAKEAAQWQTKAT